MELTLNIKGMMCAHCEARVKKTLEAFPQVAEAVVSHTAGTAVVKLSEDMDAQLLKDAVVEQGYEVV